MQHLPSMIVPKDRRTSKQKENFIFETDTQLKFKIIAN